MEGFAMTRLRTWCGVLVGGILGAAAVLHANVAVGQGTAPVQSGSPTYAIPLKDGSTAVVWWDAVSDPAHPVWRCEVSVPRGGEAARTTTALSAAAGDWRTALAEARLLLKGRVVEGE
jgi:hypothetical protein